MIRVAIITTQEQFTEELLMSALGRFNDLADIEVQGVHAKHRKMKLGERYVFWVAMDHDAVKDDEVIRVAVLHNKAGDATGAYRVMTESPYVLSLANWLVEQEQRFEPLRNRPQEPLGEPSLFEDANWALFVATNLPPETYLHKIVTPDPSADDADA